MARQACQLPRGSQAHFSASQRKKGASVQGEGTGAGVGTAMGGGTVKGAAVALRDEI